MAEKRDKREKLVNPATGRTVYADGPTGRCVKALEAQARRLGGKSSPPKKGILKAPKTSADRAMLRNRKWTRIENAPKTVSSERAYDKTRGNRTSAYKTPNQQHLDTRTENIIRGTGWKMPAGMATTRALEHESASRAWRMHHDPKGRGGKEFESANAKKPGKLRFAGGGIPLKEERLVNADRLYHKTPAKSALYYYQKKEQKRKHKNDKQPSPALPPPRVRKPKPARAGSF